MYLSTMTFVLAALPLILLLYYLVPQKWKPEFLLCCSLMLYGWGTPVRVLFLGAYICYDYSAGLLLEKFRKKRVFCTVLLIFSCLLQAAALTALRHVTHSDMPALLPVGTALFTLQGLGYLISVYRNDHPAAVRFRDLALYLSFFPTIYAGPLLTYGEFQEALSARRSNILTLGAGLSHFIRGLAEKVILGDTLYYLFLELRHADPAEMSVLTAWLTVVTFWLFLYFELQGYAQMARGLGECFGIKLPKNFHQPFLSGSITDFFRNWNMTVSAWFRSFFRSSISKTTSPVWQRSLAQVLSGCAMGFWYGTGPCFLLWGLIMGLLLLLEQTSFAGRLKKNYVGGLIYAMTIQQFTWVLFFADSLQEAALYWKCMIGFGSDLVDRYSFYFFNSYIVLLLICAYLATGLFRDLAERTSKSKPGRIARFMMPAVDVVLLVFCFAFLLYPDVPTAI